jgi:Cu(I)/Ag(I) efflux system membrane fusion protein
MSERLPAPADDRNGPAAPVPPPSRRRGFWDNTWQVLKTVQARLRFFVVLAAVGGVIVYWGTLKAWYEKLTRPADTTSAAGADVEFWCPMHPTIVRDHPDKCPLCGMPLSRRKKGSPAGDEPLSPGVASRVQLTPYRVALAGIRTTEVGYRPLMKTITATGFVEFDERKLARITARATGQSRIDRLHVNVTGQMVHKGDRLAELYSPDLVVTVQNLLDARQAGRADLQRLARDRLRLWGIDDKQIDEVVRAGKPITHLTIRSPITGHVIKKYHVEGDYVEEGKPLYDIADLSTAWIEAQVYEDEIAFVHEGQDVVATTEVFPGRPFRGTVALKHPHLDAATRTLKVRFNLDNPDHALRPGMYASVRVQTPAARLPQFRQALRQDWGSGAAGEVMAQALFTSGRPGAPGLESLLRAAVAEVRLDADLVLAVPERAVIDTGRTQLVYREAEPNVYEGVVVELGPRSDGFYPVVRGLEPGDRVATEGSFLIDAETRLTAGVGSTYFGASAGPQDNRRSAEARPSMAEDEDAKIQGVLAKLSSVDRRLAEKQQFCPIRKGNRLGVMGRPAKIYLDGKPVLLCCTGCVDQARRHPERTLRTVAAGLQPADSARQVSGENLPPRTLDPEEEADIKAALDKLAPADRALAVQQRFCPIQGENRLGEMGKPVKILLDGRPVFLCCKNCEKKARANAARTLRKVEQLRARYGPATPRKGGRP